MALTRVDITSEVFWTCTAHALTTEAEEVMGLLLGDILHGGGEVVARVWVAMPQIRTDRRKDRVEASPEQLARCSAVAERFTAVSGVATRVVGWYHSHPHITVLPSHVDVASQAALQQLDRGFVGIIVSAFNEDSATLAQQVQVTAFQSVQQGGSGAASPPQRGFSEALLSEGSLDSPMARAMAASTAESQQTSEQWERVEVPLRIVPSHGSAEQTLTDLAALPGMLFAEEHSAYQAAVEAARGASGAVPPLAAAHLAAVYQQHLCKLIDIVVGPTQRALDLRAAQTKVQSLQLKQLQTRLQASLQRQAEQPPAAFTCHSHPSSSIGGSGGAERQSVEQLVPTSTTEPGTATGAAADSSSTVGMQHDRRRGGAEDGYAVQLDVNSSILHLPRQGQQLTLPQPQSTEALQSHAAFVESSPPRSGSGYQTSSSQPDLPRVSTAFAAPVPAQALTGRLLHEEQQAEETSFDPFAELLGVDLSQLSVRSGSSER